MKCTYVNGSLSLPQAMERDKQVANGEKGMKKSFIFTSCGLNVHLVYYFQ
jgi:hypothetical protein